tara:strand:- start:38 stop:292 length:255 start_codon:yes stop_codon:yes gene_type:complete
MTRGKFGEGSKKRIQKNKSLRMSLLSQRNANELLALFQRESGGHLLGPTDPVPEVLAFLDLEFEGDKVGLLVSAQDERSRAGFL